MEIDLSVDLGSLNLANPVLTASGTFGYAQEFSEFVNLNRLGGVVTKSITRYPRPGNPPHRIVEVSCGMLNSIGLANVGVDAFIREKMPFLRTLQCRKIVNIAGECIEDYVAVLEKLASVEEDIDAYEVNLSCPNVKEGGRTFGKDPEQVFKMTRALRQMTGKPLIVKLTPNVSDIGELGKAAEEGGADILSAVNTFVGLAVDVERRRPILGTVTGGFSGPAIKPLALAKVWELRQAVDLPIIGIGGIFRANDVLEFLLVGASAVQVGTANFVDPSISEKIVDELEQSCRRMGISRIRDLIGALETT